MEERKDTGAEQGRPADPLPEETPAIPIKLVRHDTGMVCDGDSCHPVEADSSD